MRFKHRINFKKFIPLSLLTLVFFCLFTKNLNELYVVIGVYIATLLNLMMLVEIIMEVTQVVSTEGKPTPRFDKDKVITLFISKMFVLILALTLGVQIMGNRIIIAVINYIIQIFVLVFSAKKNKENI